MRAQKLPKSHSVRHRPFGCADHENGVVYNTERALSLARKIYVSRSVYEGNGGVGGGEERLL